MNESKRQMRIGVLGAGGVSRDLHLPVLINMPNIKISWICDKDEQRARQLAKMYSISGIYHNIEECCDVDIVLVAIPVGYRKNVMQTILQRRWNVFCEKPFALSLREHHQYLTEAYKNNLQVGIGLVRRYGRASILAKKLVRENHFGPILDVWASEGIKTKRTGQEAGWYMADPKAAGGGILIETGSHLVDQLCTILNVRGFKLNKCIQQNFKGLDFETRFIGTISTEQQNGIKCAFEISRLDDLCNGIFIQFSNFIMKCGLFFQDPLELITFNGDLIAKFDLPEGASTIGQAFFMEWRDFIDQCLTGKSSIVSADTSQMATEIIEHCYQNAEIIEL